ncbi:hypothetical protein CEXT_213441 [Caerostris extrusa]|uniref:Uncharacterized protein n=1 Tax=Caerostris extrusa TaxID=172846 RepID=A0AAV4NK09_CAEEX|nr:hypothetical protein CEXT_213441 [Caerostris extrusa]
MREIRSHPCGFEPNDICPNQSRPIGDLSMESADQSCKDNDGLKWKDKKFKKDWKSKPVVPLPARRYIMDKQFNAVVSSFLRTERHLEIYVTVAVPVPALLLIPKLP